MTHDAAEHSLSTRLRGVRAIELGAGVGVLGCLAAKLGAQVCITDRREILHVIQHNIEANQLQQQAQVRRRTGGSGEQCNHSTARESLHTYPVQIICSNLLCVFCVHCPNFVCSFAVRRVGMGNNARGASNHTLRWQVCGARTTATLLPPLSHRDH